MPRPPKLFWIIMLAIGAVVLFYGGSWVWWWRNVSAAQSCNNLQQWDQADTKLRQAEEIAKPFAAVDFRYNASKFLRATSYVLAGKQPLAEPLLDEVLIAYGGNSKPVFPKYLQVLIGKASVYVSQYKMAQALPLYETALKHLEAEKEVESPDGCTVMHMLAKLNRDQGFIDKAIPFFQRDLELRRKVYGAKSPEVATALYDFGFAKYIAKDYKGAAELFVEAGNQGDAKLQYAARNAVAACNMQLGKKDEARKLFETSLANQPPELEHKSITYTLGRLVRIFSEQDKMDFATRFYEQASEINEQFKQTDDESFREAATVYESKVKAVDGSAQAPAQRDKESGTGDKGDKGDKTEDKSDRAGDVTGDKTDSTGDKTGDKADRTGDVTGDKTDSTGDKTGDKTDRTGDVTGTGRGTNTGAGSGTNTGTGSGTNTGTGSGTNTGAGSGPNTGTGRRTNTGAGSGTNTGVGSGTNTGAGSGTNTGEAAPR